MRLIARGDSNVARAMHPAGGKGHDMRSFGGFRVVAASASGRVKRFCPLRKTSFAVGPPLAGVPHSVWRILTERHGDERRPYHQNADSVFSHSLWRSQPRLIEYGARS